MNPYYLLGIAAVLLLTGILMLLLRPRRKVMPKSCCSTHSEPPPRVITSTRSVGGNYQSLSSVRRPPSTVGYSPTLVPDDSASQLAAGVVLGSALSDSSRRATEEETSRSSVGNVWGHSNHPLPSTPAPDPVILESPEPTKFSAPVYESPVSIPDSSPVSIPDSSPIPDVTVDSSNIC